MKLEDYLEQIQSSESMFAMDSFELPKKKKIIRKYLPPRHLGEQNKYELQSGIHRAMIDFDGPIHKFSKGSKDGTIYDEPSEGVKEVINLELQANNTKLLYRKGIIKSQIVYEPGIKFHILIHGIHKVLFAYILTDQM